jgi:putative endonuclease
MFYVYVLQSLKTKEFYKGLTDDIDRRLHQHFSGYSHSTKNKLPLKLIHVEICQDRLETRHLEKFFKSGFGREIISELAEVVEW